MKKINFEESLSRLEKIVDILEQGNIDLEESIKLYEEGKKISKECYDILEISEQKVVELYKNTEEK
jgi:exodeoxyribonuclease VII small subunit